MRLSRSFLLNADRIYSELAALRRTKDPNPNGADTSVVDDLYSFAAYISNDTENIALYKAMDTKKLWEIFDPASRRYSQRNDDLGKLCGSLSAAGKKHMCLIQTKIGLLTRDTWYIVRMNLRNCFPQ